MERSSSVLLSSPLPQQLLPCVCVLAQIYFCAPLEFMLLRQARGAVQQGKCVCRIVATEACTGKNSGKPEKTSASKGATKGTSSTFPPTPLLLNVYTPARSQKPLDKHTDQQSASQVTWIFAVGSSKPRVGLSIKRAQSSTRWKDSENVMLGLVWHGAGGT